MQARFIELHHRTRKNLERLMLEALSDGSYRVSKRIHAVLLNSEERSSGEISKILKTSRSKVSEWLKIYEEQGFEGLKEGHRSGRPSWLTDIQKITLCDIIDSGPIAFGYSSGIWTSKRIAQAIFDEFGITYHEGHVRKLLYDFGFSVQSPKRVLALADKEKQAKWTSFTYPEIKKKPIKSKLV
jgi:transposase